MFIEIAALFSIFHLIIAENSTDLQLAMNDDKGNENSRHPLFEMFDNGDNKDSKRHVLRVYDYEHTKDFGNNGKNKTSRQPLFEMYDNGDKKDSKRHVLRVYDYEHTKDFGNNGDNEDPGGSTAPTITDEQTKDFGNNGDNEDPSGSTDPTITDEQTKDFGNNGDNEDPGGSTASTITDEQTKDFGNNGDNENPSGSTDPTITDEQTKDFGNNGDNENPGGSTDPTITDEQTKDFGNNGDNEDPGGSTAPTITDEQTKDFGNNGDNENPGGSTDPTITDEQTKDFGNNGDNEDPGGSTAPTITDEQTKDFGSNGDNEDSKRHLLRMYDYEHTKDFGNNGDNEDSETPFNLMLDNEENPPITDDMLFKNIVERLELLMTVNENLRVKMTSLGVMFTEHLTKQRTEIRDDLEELKQAIIKKMGTGGAGGASRAMRDGSVPSTTDDEETCEALPTNCADAMKETGRSGVYTISIPGSKLQPFFVYCLKNSSIESTVVGDEKARLRLANKDAWIVIQRRRDGSIDFLRNWEDYQNGFGNLEGEFWIGLNKLHAITESRLHELWIQMEDFDEEKRWVRYSSFAIGSESDDYALNILGNYSGDAGDSLTFHSGAKFSTKDKDNDDHKKTNCANVYNGAWWYKACLDTNLNGKYLKGQTTEVGHGVTWYQWRGAQYSMKYVHMALRPVYKTSRCG